MLTKEELLQKGVSEESADKIIKAYNSDTEENSLLELKKALNGENQEEKKENEENETDDYDKAKKYMKKYMKRYMKENPEYCKKMMKKFSNSSEKLEKATENFDLNSDGGVIEMIDLAPFLEAQTEFNQEMIKAVSGLSEKVENINENTNNSYDLMQKAAKVQIEQADSFNSFLSIPQGRKAKISNLNKGSNLETFSKEENSLIYQTLLKAVKNGDEKAGPLISAFESRGKNINNLNPVQKQALNQFIMKKEVN